MGKKLAFWGDCNGYGYKIIRILEELGGINVSNYGATEVTSLYYIDEKNHIKGTYNGDLDKEKYVIMTYQDFITKYPFQVYDIVYATDNHEEGKVIEILWDETKGRMRYLVDFENTTSWVFVDDIFSYEPKDNSDCGTAIKPMKVKSNAVKLVDNKVIDNLDEGKTKNKKLAIVGHPTRSNEIIELLEMMGGVNSKNFSGKCDFFYFFIDNDNIISSDSNFNNNFAYFTLEDFLKKYPFKVGDKVNVLFKSYIDENEYCESTTTEVKSMRWNETLGKVAYKVKYCSSEFYAEQLKPHKEEVSMEDDKTKPSKMKNVLAELFEHIKTTPKEDIEREFEEIEEWSNVGPTVEEFMDFCNKVNKKPKYPDNYEECVRIAKNIHGYDIHIDAPAYRGEAESIIKLLICRNAYWKIAGEQMGLGKPWEPNWGSFSEGTYPTITKCNGNIVKTSVYTHDCPLAFPSEEMRDAFYENFKELIESCKELL